MLFDGDVSHLGTADESDTIKKNRSILSLFGNTDDFPDNSIKDDFLGFTHTLNENLGFETSNKGLKLYKQVRQKLTTAEQVPEWVSNVKSKVESLVEFKESVLLR